MKNAIFSLLLIFMSLGMNAQFDQKIEYIVITKTDGTVLKGIFKEMTSLEITFFSNGKYHTINRNDITDFSIGDSWSAKGDMASNENDHNDQYLLFQSALPAGKGNHYYRNYNFLVNQVTIGLSDQFTFSGGLETISIFFDQSSPIFFFTPKFSFGQDNVHFSISSTTFVNGSDFAGLASAHMTIGNRKNNITLGLSLSYVESEVEDELIVNLGGVVALNEKLSITTEIMALNDFGILLFDIGLRYVADSGVGADASLLYFGDVDIPIPVIGIKFPFSSK